MKRAVQNERRQVVYPLWWAIIGPRDGYVTEVYPGEATHYRRNIPGVFGGGRRLVGEFMTEAQAKAALMDALGRRNARGVG